MEILYIALNFNFFAIAQYQGIFRVCMRAI